METEKLALILESNLSRNIGWIAAADAKTGFVFTIDLAMLGSLAAASPAYGEWSVSGVTVASIAAALLALSLVSLSLAVFPRTVGPRLSLIFFGAVASRDIDSYRSDLMSLDPAAHIEDLIQQVHINAKIAAMKYTWLKRATVFLYVSILPWCSAAYILFRDK